MWNVVTWPLHQELIYLHWRATSLPLKSWFHPKPNCTVVAAGNFAFVFAPLAPLAFFKNGHGWFLEFFGTRPLPLRQFAPFLQVSRLFTPWSLIHLNSAFIVFPQENCKVPFVCIMTAFGGLILLHFFCPRFLQPIMVQEPFCLIQVVFAL